MLCIADRARRRGRSQSRGGHIMARTTNGAAVMKVVVSSDATDMAEVGGVPCQ